MPKKLMKQRNEEIKKARLENPDAFPGEELVKIFPNTDEDQKRIKKEGKDAKDKALYELTTKKASSPADKGQRPQDAPLSRRELIEQPASARGKPEEKKRAAQSGKKEDDPLMKEVDKIFEMDHTQQIQLNLLRSLSLIGITDFYTLNYCIANEFKNTKGETFAAAKLNEGNLRVAGATLKEVKHRIH